MIYLRLISFFFLMIGAVFLPLPVVLSFFIICLSVFSKFWEAIFVGIVLDALYFSPMMLSVLGLSFFTVSFILLVLLIEKIKCLIGGENALSKLLVAGAGGAVFYLLLFLFYTR